MSQSNHKGKPRAAGAISTGAPHYEAAGSRRDFLARAGGGFGALALSHLLQQDGAFGSSITPPAMTHGSADGKPSPLAPKLPHYFGRAKHVIFVFIEGGPSHIDLFDPKPKLNELAGQPLPASFKRPLTAMGEAGSPLLACKRKWAQHGQAGTWVSDWLPHTAKIVDDIAVVRSCCADGLNHVGSVCQMNTGSVLAGRPSLGAWVTYGLGTENQDLPAFVVLLDKGTYVVGGPRNWATGFMPSTYQGTTLRATGEPIPNLNPPKGVSRMRQRGKLDYLKQINQDHAASREFVSDLDARIRAYELAYRMQAEAPEAVDLEQESKATQELYGYNQGHTRDMARCCIMARRLVERGVRFVQIYSGAGSKWDAHSNIESNHSRMCGSSDQPVAALVQDLKQRGLLDETLVVWGGEFGRTPMSEKGNGRDHNPWGFTQWFAGGGVKGGQTIGATDDLGLYVTEDRAHVHDLHASILHAAGLDHTRLTYPHNGLPERATVNEGHVIEKLFV